MNELRNDKNLQEAVSRREQKLPPLPADLNERLMQRLGEPETASVAKQRPLWLYAAVAVAASIALLIVFNFGKEQPPQEPVVAQQTYHGDGSSDTPSTNESNHGDRSLIRDEARDQATCPHDSRPRDTKKKQRKEVMQLVELIPTSETASNNMKTLPASVIDKVKAYDQASDPSRMTGIDDGTDAIVTTTMGIDDIDPLVAMAAQVENIRQRGQRLEREIELKMDN